MNLSGVSSIFIIPFSVSSIYVLTGSPGVEYKGRQQNTGIFAFFSILNAVGRADFEYSP